MSTFALQVGLAIIIMSAAAVAAVLLHRQASIRRDRGESGTGDYVRDFDLQRGLRIVRGEFQHSIEAAQASASRASRRAEHVVAMVRPIEQALRDLDQRIADLQERADPSPLQELAQLARQHGRFADADRPQEREQRQKALIGLLSTLTQAIEGVTVRQDKGATVPAVEDRLGGLQRQMDGLIHRLDLGERGRADLSALTDELVDAIEGLRVSSEKTAKRVADLERRFLSNAVVPDAPQSAGPGNLRPTANVTEATANIAAKPSSTPVAGDASTGAPHLPDEFVPPVHDVIHVGQTAIDTAVGSVAAVDRGAPGVDRESKDRTEPPAASRLPGRNLQRQVKLRRGLRKSSDDSGYVRSGLKQSRSYIDKVRQIVAEKRGREGPRRQKQDASQRMKPKKITSQKGERAAHPEHFPARVRLAFDPSWIPVRLRKMRPRKVSRSRSDSAVQYPLKRRWAFTRKQQIARGRHAPHLKAPDDARPSGNAPTGAPREG